MKKMYPHLPNDQIRKCRKGYFEAICTDLVKENDHLLNSETENKFFVGTKTQAEQSKALQMFSLVFSTFMETDDMEIFLPYLFKLFSLHLFKLGSIFI